MAGSIADGVHVHPLNTRTYLTETVLPELALGAERTGRNRRDLHITVPCFTAVGDSDEERARWRELARAQIAFYGSTPNYAFIFDQIGFDGTTERIRERQKAGDLSGMTAVITDDILEHFVVTAGWDELAGKLLDRYQGMADRVVSYFARLAWDEDPASLERWSQVTAEIKASSPPG